MVQGPEQPGLICPLSQTSYDQLCGVQFLHAPFWLPCAAQATPRYWLFTCNVICLLPCLLLLLDVLVQEDPSFPGAPQPYSSLAKILVFTTFFRLLLLGSSRRSFMFLMGSSHCEKVLASWKRRVASVLQRWKPSRQESSRLRSDPVKTLRKSPKSLGSPRMQFAR